MAHDQERPDARCVGADFSSSSATGLSAAGLNENSPDGAAPCARPSGGDARLTLDRRSSGQYFVQTQVRGSLWVSDTTVYTIHLIPERTYDLVRPGRAPGWASRTTAAKLVEQPCGTPD